MNDSMKGSLSVLLGAFLISFSPVFVGWYFILSGLERTTAVTTGLILLSQPIFSYLWDVMLFEKVISQREFFGIFLVIFAMIICVSAERYIENRAIQ